MSTDIETTVEPLPGYRLVEHLGSGGYGEVWSAEAPGGLMKAIKFVFGNHQEKRASHEMKALDRVRSVRHPFLLSLERIEVVNGRLLVVTELAEGSLKGRFDECRKGALSGIPRDELIRYLRDAADALDFMISVHKLGHLDIKPENLLLLAGHVKVADFGLVKDVRQSQASLVGGMTPLYAAPEVFRGLPGSNSDQYSLAIVYQEMLSGILPFRGGNAAELTLQHLNDEPDLSMLPDGDRYVMSRALAKDPAHRYSSCREFLDALANVANQTTPKSDSSESSSSNQLPSLSGAGRIAGGRPTESRPTDVFETDETDNALDTAGILISSPLRHAEVIDLQPVAIDSAAAIPTPTLVIGIGGAAGRVLGHFRGLVQEQNGTATAFPAVQTLLIETDAGAAAEATRSDRGGLAPGDVITLPLQRPQNYRDQSQQLLRWLSRRWLYNIPKSLRTEGLRPLGRLALTDHARQAGQAIRRGITQAIDSEALAASGRALGCEFRRDEMQVFVVASISGGTGSGMSIDIGYAVRSILEKLGLAKSQITGVLLHSTGGDAQHCELARVNAFSWLTEFNHFHRPEAVYPGDISCGFPPHAKGVKPFDETYLVHLGDQIDPGEFEAATRAIAEYLRLNILTPAKAFFGGHRASTSGSSDNGGDRNSAPLRSFGIFRRTSTAAGACDHVANLVTARILDHWRHGREMTQTASGGDTVASATAEAQLVRRMRLDCDGMIGNMRALVEMQFGGDAQSYLATLLSPQGSSPAGRMAHWQPVINQLFNDPSGAAATGTSWLLGQPATTAVEPLVEKLRSEIRRWFSGRLEDPHARLQGARQSLVNLAVHLTSMEQSLSGVQQSTTAKLVRGQSIAVGNTNPQSISPNEYFDMRLNLVAAEVAAQATRLLQSDIKIYEEELISLGRELDHFAVTMEWQGTVNAPDNCEKLKAWLQPRLDELASDVDGRLCGDFLHDQALWSTISQGGRRRAQLCATLNEFARQAAMRSIEGMNTLDGAAADCNSAADLRSHLATATPSLLAQGGARRVLAILPKDDTTQLVAKEFSTHLQLQPNTLVGSDNNLTLCVEASGLSASEVAVELVQRRRDRLEFAGRVQTRNDIGWTPLVVDPTEASLSAWVELERTPAMTGQFTAKTMVLQ